MRIEQKWQRVATYAFGYRCGIHAIGIIYQTWMQSLRVVDNGKHYHRPDAPRQPIVELHAINSRGQTGSCYIAVPVEEIPTMIRNLQTIYDQRTEL